MGGLLGNVISFESFLEVLEGRWREGSPTAFLRGNEIKATTNDINGKK
jgi:hypothetical protein